MSDDRSRIEHMNEGSVHPDDMGLESTGDTDVDAALALLAQGVAAVNALDLDALVRLDSPSTGLHAAARNVELLRRRLAVFDSHYVAAVEVGDEPARYARPSTAAFLREQLRLSGGEAQAAGRPGPRDHPGAWRSPGKSCRRRVRAWRPGSRAGEVSGEHARIVLDTLAKLPARSASSPGRWWRPRWPPPRPRSPRPTWRCWPAEVMVRADPDGTLRDVDHAHKQRGLRLWKKRGRAGYTLQRRPGPGDRRSRPGRPGRLVQTRPRRARHHPTATAERGWADQPGPARRRSPRLGRATVAWSEMPGSRDARPHDVRMHDAFGRRPQSHPELRGPARLRWHPGRHRLAHQRHPAPRPARPRRLRARHPAPDRRRPPRCADQSPPVRPDREQPRASRSTSAGPPGSPPPARPSPWPPGTAAAPSPAVTGHPSHCQRHHITDWANGGPTDIDNLTLLCGYHHREFAKRGWNCLMMRAGYRTGDHPPGSTPHRTPIRNTRHFTLPTPHRMNRRRDKAEPSDQAA